MYRTELEKIEKNLPLYWEVNNRIKKLQDKIINEAKKIDKELIRRVEDEDNTLKTISEFVTGISLGEESFRWEKNYNHNEFSSFSRHPMRIKGHKMADKLKELYDSIFDFQEKNNIPIDFCNGEYEDYGNSIIYISPRVDISHIGNLFQTLIKLADEDYSLISHNAYTGIEVIEYKYIDLVVFHINVEYVFVETKEKTVSFLKKNCNESLIEKMLDMIADIQKLGFSNIELTYSHSSHENFLELQSKRESEGIYDIDILDSQLKEYKSNVEKIEGFMKTIKDIDNVITTIRNSEDDDSLITNLQEKHTFSRNQAEWIACSKLSDMTDEEKIQEYEEEREILLKKIESIENLLVKLK